ncbi:MAG: class I SAM-dependent methyltransferase [Bacteroidota bacterium]
MQVTSPFDSTKTCDLVEHVKTEEIVRLYRDNFQTDVERFFKGIDQIAIYKCPLSQLEFFYPIGLDGDSRFYEELSKGAWYYQTERWENNQALSFIKPGDRVLEIGSGSGFFGKFLAGKVPGASYLGLELNEKAVKDGVESGIPLIAEDSRMHSLKNSESYDVVCSFQVFEHVSNIKALYEDAIKLLRPGGYLLVAVPNNDNDFLRRNVMYSKVLNMPPHHVNLFTPESLGLIGKLMGLKIEKTLNEPLMQLNRDTFLYNTVNRVFFGISLFTKAFWKLRLHLLLRPIASLFKNMIDGHTVMVVYRKPS